MMLDAMLALVPHEIKVVLDIHAELNVTQNEYSWIMVEAEKGNSPNFLGACVFLSHSIIAAKVQTFQYIRGGLQDK